jgi:hypothetical protein
LYKRIEEVEPVLEPKEPFTNEMRSQPARMKYKPNRKVVEDSVSDFRRVRLLYQTALMVSEMEAVKAEDSEEDGMQGPGAATGGNHALQDYQPRLMLFEQENKKRLMMARQEQDNISRDPSMPGPGQFGDPNFPDQAFNLDFSGLETSDIPMSPQSNQGGWMSATSSDTAEPRSRPVRSPSYRATSPMSHGRDRALDDYLDPIMREPRYREDELRRQNRGLDERDGVKGRRGPT